MQRWAYVDGTVLPIEDAKVNVEDRGLQFGDGVYEVIRLYQGVPFTFDRHLARLQRSAAKIRIDFPNLIETAKQVADALIQKSGEIDGALYFQVTRGTAPRNHPFPIPAVSPRLIATLSPLPALTQEQRWSGIAAIVLADERWLHCDIKATDLLPNILARQAAIEQGAEEAILARDFRIVTEGASSNVFIVQSGVLRTHPDGPFILPGITKEVTLECAASLGLQVDQRPFTVEELRAADEIFITNTTHEICPVTQLDGVVVGNGTAGPITRQLQEVFLSRCQQEVSLLSQHA
ncbi:MAG: D-amino-acid transaminase [Firmicutes bacterium]|nr:D-amino-acid transaminase [Bacillota bacterium]